MPELIFSQGADPLEAKMSIWTPWENGSQLSWLLSLQGMKIYDVEIISGWWSLVSSKFTWLCSLVSLLYHRNLSCNRNWALEMDDVRLLAKKWTDSFQVTPRKPTNRPRFQWQCSVQEWQPEQGTRQQTNPTCTLDRKSAGYPRSDKWCIPLKHLRCYDDGKYIHS